MNPFIYEAVLSVHIYSDISCFLCQFQFFISVINQNHDLATLFPCKTKSNFENIQTFQTFLVVLSEDKHKRLCFTIIVTKSHSLNK